jgi:hypothetical protein
MDQIQLTRGQKRALARFGKKAGTLGIKALKKRLGKKRRRQRNNRRSAMSETIHRAPVAQARNIRTVNSQATKLVTHREYVKEIYGTEEFTVSALSINPGLPSLFPWLWALSNRYEHYNFQSCRFVYKSQAPTSTTGAIMMAIDYNVDDSAPTSKQQMLSYHGAVRAAPWTEQSMSTSARGNNARKPFFVRNGAVDDAKLYDTGNLYVATVGQSNTDAIGELWVEYSVLLSTPQSDGSVPGGWLYSDQSITNYDTETGDFFPSLSSSSGPLPCEIISYSYDHPESYTSNYALKFSFTGVFMLNLVVNNADGDIDGLLSSTVTFPNGDGDFAWYTSDGLNHFEEVIYGNLRMILNVPISVQRDCIAVLSGVDYSVAPTGNSDSSLVVSYMGDGLGFPGHSVTSDSVARALALLQAS